MGVKDEGRTSPNSGKYAAHTKGSNMFTNTKQFKRTILGTTTLALALTAGTSVALGAGPDDNKDKGEHMRQHTMQPATRTSDPVRTRTDVSDTGLLHFADSGTLIGSKVRGTGGDELGSINDFIVDRGSGRIAFAIVSSGDFLGIGGKQFAMPYAKLSFTSPNNEYTTRMTQQQIERQTQFLPENWNDLTQVSWMDKVTGMGDNETRIERDREMSQRLKAADRREIKGTVTRVEQRSEDGNDMTVIWVSDRDSADRVNLDRKDRTKTNDRSGTRESGTREIVLGPSWYVMGMDSSVRTGDPVNLSVSEYDGQMYAMNGRAGDHELRLRDGEGRGYWNASDQQAKRYLLLSQLTGHQVEIAGSTAGEVQNTVVEAPSGYVAFIGLDPNDNLFGIGDDISLIPWSAVRIGPKLDVTLEGSNAQIERTLTMPDDLSTLRTPTSVAQAYNAFGQDMPKFTPRDREDHAMRGERRDRDMSDRDNTGRRDMKDRDTKSKVGDAWSKDSTWTKAFANGDKVTIEGVYVGMKAVSLDEGAPEAQVLLIDTTDGRKNLILGPSWYVDRQQIDLSGGDKIKVVGRKASYNGNEWIAAWNVQHESDSWTFWNDTTPAWTK